MSTQAKGALILVGLTTLGALCSSGLEARGSSITITGQQRPGSGDPVYEYIFDVTLQANSSIQSGDSFTIYSLIGIIPANFPAPGDLGSSAMAPSVVWSPTIGLPTQLLFPYASDVTWTYNGSIPIQATSAPVDLGQFIVETAFSFQSPPYADGALIDYSYNIGGQSSPGSGLFPMSVPEPSSLFILLTGTGVVLLFPLIYRQRCRRRQSQLRVA
ncbi:MAG: hypothetical protein ACLQIB_40845 [Isosphaeraceae bacterium]